MLEWRMLVLIANMFVELVVGLESLVTCRTSKRCSVAYRTSKRCFVAYRIWSDEM
jgi:hypothetical protein